MDRRSNAPVLLAKEALESHLNLDLEESQYEEIAAALFELALILIESN